MHYLPFLGAGVAALAVMGLMPRSEPGTTPDAATLRAAPEPPVAAGHHVLVVEGDRAALSITAAAWKPEPWAGVPKGFASDWVLRIADAGGELLAAVPLDVSAFATGAGDAGGPDRVEGCIVRSPRIGMLVNAPAFAAAASYTFVRPADRGGEAVLGTVPGTRVRELAGGGR
jgi:hypothetical protein